MNCRKAKKLLTRYSGSLRSPRLNMGLNEANGIKEGKKLTELKEHLSVCSECRRLLVSLEHTERLLFAIPLKEPPARLWDGLRARIVAEAVPEKLRWKGWFGKRNSAVALATFAIVLIFVGFFFLRPFFTSQESISPDRLASIYVEQHALRTWRDPLADKAWLGWSVQLITAQEMKRENQ